MAAQLPLNLLCEPQALVSGLAFSGYRQYSFLNQYLYVYFSIKLIKLYFLYMRVEMIFKNAYLLFAALAVVSGCATQRFDFVNTPVNTAPALDDDQTFWVGGIGQTAEIDAAKTCGAASKVVRIETMQTAGDVALTLVTLGIYAPRHMRVICK